MEEGVKVNSTNPKKKISDEKLPPINNPRRRKKFNTLKLDNDK